MCSASTLGCMHASIVVVLVHKSSKVHVLIVPIYIGIQNNTAAKMHITMCARIVRNDVIDNSPIRSVIFENLWMFESSAARSTPSRIFSATADSIFICTNGQKVSCYSNFDMLILSDSCSVCWRSDQSASSPLCS